MTEFLLMPALVAGAQEAKLLTWHVRAGESFAAGQPLAEFESDKAVVDLTAETAGVVEDLLVPAGTDGVKVGTAIARLRALDAVSGAPGPGAVPMSTSTDAAGSQSPTIQHDHLQGVAAVSGVAANERTRISPLARRMAREAGIDPAGLEGSGPAGRIVKRDVERARQHRAAPGLLPLDGMRAAIARRLTESFRDVPQFPLVMDADVDALIALRVRMNEAQWPGVPRISINDFVLRACALALARFGDVNASFTAEGIVRHRHADIAVAVALDDGLITPVVRRAEEKDLVEIARETRELTTRARARQLAPGEFQGGTFTVSNLGMLGIRQFGSILNPPQACILSVGAAEPRPVVRHGQLAIATVMTLTLTCDHRIVDGAAGARFLSEIRRLLEQPATIAGAAGQGTMPNQRPIHADEHT